MLPLNCDISKKALNMINLVEHIQGFLILLTGFMASGR